MNGKLQNTIVRVLKPNGQTAGTGFVIADAGLVATCAHVIEGAKAGLGDTVLLVFHATKDEQAAQVEYWRDPGGQDVAILRLKSPLPDEVRAVLLGESFGTDDHPIKTFGFPEDKPVEGMPGGGKVVGSTTEAGYRVLGLRSQEITTGFSGAPVLDTSTRRVIGMVTSITRPDEFGRKAQTAFITPTEALKEVCPPLLLTDICPYRGLNAFGETDSSFFFGRDTLIERLLSKLKQESSFLAVLGPSGSGKSSLVQAGLIPSLREGKLPGSQRWGLVVIRPSSNPFEELSNHGLTSQSKDLKILIREWLEHHPNHERLVLIIDQFEELFTACPRPLSRTFLNQLTQLLDAGESATLILTMRDEFYSHFTQEAPGLVGWLERGTANLPPTLTRKELIEIVEKPAKAVGLSFEGHLVETVVEDAMGLDSKEEEERVGRSTILPLLEFALTQLWELRKEGLLTYDAYKTRVSGVTGALTNWADREFRRIEKSRRHLALHVLTDLVYLGDEDKGIPDTRRRRAISELWRNERQEVQRIVQLLVAARLLVTSGETVELIHDALLREWGLLKSRLRDDRLFLRWRQGVESRVDSWLNTASPDIANRDAGKLLAGGDLIEAERWLAARVDDLNEAERTFVEESLARREAQHQRELEQKRELEEALARAEAQLAVSESQRLAFAARTALTARPETSLLLACEAVHWDHNPLTEELLRDTLENIPWLVRAFVGHSQGVNSAVFSRDAQRILTASEDHTARIWDTSGHALVCFSAHTGSVTCAVFSPDEERILTTSEDGTARLWHCGGECIATLTYPTSGGHHSHLTKGAFSPDGQLVLVCDYDKAWLWEGNGRLIPTKWDARPKRARDEGHVRRIFSASFSPDGQRVVTASEDGSARIWDLSGQQLTILQGHENMVINAVFSQPDGKLILTGSIDKTARLWNADGELIATLPGHAADVGHLAFSPDGQLLFTAVHGGGVHDAVIRLWNRSGKPLSTLDTGHSDWIRDIAVSLDGQRILTASSDGTARLFDVKGATLAVFRGHLDRVECVAFSQDGRLMLTASQDGTARLWEPAEALLPSLKGHSKPVTRALYSADGSHILTSSLDGTTCLWSLDGQRRATYSGTANLDEHVLSPDGRHLLTVQDESRRVNLWQLPPDVQWFRDSERETHQVTPSVGHPHVDGQASPLVAITSPTDGPESSFTIPRAVFSSSGERILTLLGGSAALWDRHGKLVAIVEGPNLNPSEKPTVDFATFSSCGQHLLTGSLNGTVWVWATNGKLISSFLADSGSARDNLFSVSFSPDGQRILTTIRQSASLWDLGGGLLVELPCNTNKVKRGLFSPEGDRILTVAEAAIPDVRLWDSEGELIACLSAIGAAPITFDRKGERLCIVDGNLIKIWDRDGSPIATLVAERGTWIRRVAFSPDGEYLLAACSSGIAQLWVIKGQGTLQSTFRGHTAEVNSAVFSPDGKRALTASSDATSRQFIVHVEDLVASSARRTGRCLDAQETAQFNVRTPLRFDPKRVSPTR